MSYYYKRHKKPSPVLHYHYEDLHYPLLSPYYTRYKKPSPSGYYTKEPSSLMSYHYDEPSKDDLENLLETYRKEAERQLEVLGQHGSNEHEHGASQVRFRSVQLSTPMDLLGAGQAAFQANPVVNKSAARRYHTSRAVQQQIFQQESLTSVHSFPEMMHSRQRQRQRQRQPGIRERLRLWQEQYGQPNLDDPPEAGVELNTSGVRNDLQRLGNPDDLRDANDEEDVESERLTDLRRSEEPEDIDTKTTFLRRGDLVELSYPSNDREPVLAVMVRDFESQSQFYTMRGKWIHRKLRDVQFTIPRFTDPSMLDGLIPYLPAGEVTKELLDLAQAFDLSVPREVASPVIDKLTEFWRETDAVYRKNASILDNAHRVLAHPTDLRFGSLERIAQKLVGGKTRQVSAAALYAVRRALMHNGYGFGIDERSHRVTSVFQIRSKDSVEMIETVVSWLRDFQDDLAFRASQGDTLDDGAASSGVEESKGARIVKAFLKKARRLIAESRTLREPTESGCVGPSKIQHSITDPNGALVERRSLEFTADEQKLIRFMESWSMSQSFRRHTRLQALGPMVLRAVGVYENQGLGPQTGNMFLQEIGVLVPFENRVAYDEHLLLPTSQHSHPLQLLATSVAKVRQDKEETPFEDTMKDLRKDWKDLAVFCVDSATAHEIDDGISLERIPGLPSEYWVHVHVANPSAFFDRSHPVAKMAAHMTESIYMPERPYTMLPQWLTGRYFSLAPDRPALTFSARVNQDAKILDVKVQPSIIRNVVPLTPASLKNILGLKTVERPDVTLTVGGKIPEVEGRKLRDTVTKLQRQDLMTLQSLATSRYQQRRRGGGLFMEQGYPEMSVFNRADMTGLPRSRPYREGARFIEGDPLIHMRTQEFKTWFASGDDEQELMVREVMLMCCEIAALWCRERNIPVIYRGTVRNPNLMSPDQFDKEVLQPSLDEHGKPPMYLVLKYFRLLGQMLLSTTPLEHRVIGVPQYAKVTSPLRRYGDMVAHWQIEAALREEAKTGQSLVCSTRSDYLAFKRPEVEMIINRLQPRERLIRRSMRNAESFWLTQLLFRAHYFGEAALPETLTGMVLTKGFVHKGNVGVIIKEYGFDCDMVKPELLGLGFGEAELGDWWEVRIRKIDVYMRRVLVEPVRLISRDAAT